jgi:hypothetical protein
MTALIYVLLLLFGSGATVDSDLMKQAVTALLTTLTAVAAFYFGSRTAETSGAGGSTEGEGGGGLAPPTISTFSPSSGPPGTEITIEGTGLETTTKVAIGGALAPFRFDTGAAALIASVPSGAAAGKIEVTSPGGAGTSKDDFTVENPP